MVRGKSLGGILLFASRGLGMEKMGQHGEEGRMVMSNGISVKGNEVGG